MQIQKLQINKNNIENTILFLGMLFLIFLINPISSNNLLTKSKPSAEQDVNFTELNNLLNLHSNVVGSSTGSLSINAGPTKEAQVRFGSPNNFLTFTQRTIKRFCVDD